SPPSSNSIRTARYTIWSFVPRQLYAQFSKIANVYFLFISILQLIPGLSATGQFTTIIPLSIFTCLAMAHEAWDDYRRHRMDVVENERECEVLRIHRPGSQIPPPSQSGPLSDSSIPSYSTSSPARPSAIWEKTRWKDLGVGDVVRIRSEDWVPADLLLLSSSSEDGSAYVETAALDGETNMKHRRPPSGPLDAATRSASGLAGLQGWVSAELPHQELYSFTGFIQAECGLVGSGKRIRMKDQCPLGIGHLLLRGTRIKNVSWAHGLVLYTGEESKVRLNALKRPPIKAPAIQRQINRAVISIFAMLLFLVILLTILNQSWSSVFHPWYLPPPDHSLTFIVQTAAGYIVLMNTLIPISLYVTMEIVKVFQAYLITQDLGMWDPRTSTRAAARTSAINEDLGQVSCVFSDKTGTLTENEMRLRAASVSGRIYLWEEDPDDLEDPTKANDPPGKGGKKGRRGKIRRTLKKRVKALKKRRKQWRARRHSRHSHHPSKGKRRDKTLREMRETEGKATTALPIHGGEDAWGLVERAVMDPGGPEWWFTWSVALCHTVTVYQMFQGPSPDEQALVEGMARMGWRLLQGSDRASGGGEGEKSLVIVEDAGGERSTFHLLAILAFTTARRRMSVIVGMPDGSVVLLTKGADSSVLPLCTDDSAFNPQPPSSDKFTDPTDPLPDKRGGKRHLQEFASQGLRTLVYARRTIPEEEWIQWRDGPWKQAERAIVDREEAQAQASALLEHSLTVCGVSAVEDRLQRGVPETVSQLRTAGIRAWMLTGDKLETAVNIGRSCGLIGQGMSVVEISKGIQSMGSHLLSTFFSHLQSLPRRILRRPLPPSSSSSFLGPRPLLDLFLDVALPAATVICCRVSPAQKAGVVRAVRLREPQSVSLAIGDGGNDIAMIQEAQVGIGIAGREGLAAARASDYSIGQFRFLARLLLVHGAWSYNRVAKFTLGTFHKCACFYVTQAAFQVINGYSGTSLYEQWTLSLYNTIFSSLPVMVVGVTERACTARTLLQFPELYGGGRRSEAFNLRVFWRWQSSAVIQSILCMAIPYFAYYGIGGSGENLGATPQLYLFGITVYTSVLIVVTLKVCFLEARYWSPLTLIAATLSLAAWILFQVAYSLAYSKAGSSMGYYIRGVFFQAAFHGVDFWLVIFLTSALALLPDLAMQVAWNTFRPSLTLLHQEREAWERKRSRTQDKWWKWRREVGVEEGVEASWPGKEEEAWEKKSLPKATSRLGHGDRTRPMRWLMRAHLPWRWSKSKSTAILPVDENVSLRSV
ncbi:MAG: hypothetical protein DHS80DRAFT_18695, partial [Piptocephalis tieghemiana]